MISFNNRKNMLRIAGLTTASFALTLGAGTAHAQDSSMFSFSGFGTFGAAHLNSSNGDYVATLYQPSGAGISHDWDIATDSKLGAQVNAQLSDKLSAVVQVISMARTNNTFGPRIEWANLQYAITPDLKVRIGRTVLPTFMVSDTRLVGYANTWIRPPVEMYTAMPITNIDGADASYKSRFGSVANTVQVYGGMSKTNAVGGDGTVLSGIKMKKALGITDSIEYGAWTGRIGYSKADLTIPFSPTFSLNAPLRTFNVGAAYDQGSLFIQGEFARVTAQGLASAQKVSYITAGYRFGSWTPYAMYVNNKASEPNERIAHDQKTLALGLRWDVFKNTAIKVEAEHIKVGKNSVGNFLRAKPELAGSTVNLLSFAVDFVF